jgi:hypothetical protein
MIEHWRFGTVAVAFSALVASSAIAFSADAASTHNGCAAGARVDGSTAMSAKKKMHAAGFSHINGLKKGCDNYWHGKAVKDGVATRVVLPPDGSAMPEGN